MAALPPFDPFSSVFSGSREDVCLKVCLVWLQMETQENMQACQAKLDLQLEVCRRQIEADKQVKLRWLSCTAKPCAGPRGFPAV